MRRLGYTSYVAQGGDWGSPVSSSMARQAVAELLGIHINLPATVPPDIAAVLASGGPAPAGLSNKERAAFNSLMFYKKYRAYGAIMGTRPQTIGYALTDFPSGLRPGYSITTTASPNVGSTETTCWTTSRCTG